jgi:hypothetical protein
MEWVAKLVDLIIPRSDTPGASAINGEKSSPLGRFFRLVKDLTVDGYHTSRPGLTDELGWKANTFLSEFKGCVHPEHQG